MKYLTSLSTRYFYIHLMMIMAAISLAVIIVLQSVNVGHVIDGVLKKHIPYSLLSVVLLILIGRSMLHFTLKWLGMLLSYRIKHQLRKQLTAETRPTAETLNLSTEGIEGIDSFYADYIPQLYRSMMIPSAIIIFLLFFHHNAAFIMLITAPFIPLFYIIIGINTANKASEQMQTLNRFSSYFLDAVRGIVTVKLFNNEERVRQGISDKSEGFRAKTMVILKTAFLSTLMIEFIAMLSIGIIALEIGLGLIVFKTVSFYTAVVTLMLAPEFYNALKDLGAAFHTGKQAEGYAELLETKRVAENERCYTVRDDIKLDVSKSYAHFTLTIRDTLPLRHAVIMGPSGAGKSTFAKILSGIEEGEGSIILPEELKNNILYMSQQPFVMSETVRNNITMFNEVGDDLLFATAEKVGILERIEELPDGFDTIIGNGGEQLSGGELHRVMLMRALLNPASLIILDEPTAMLDAQTEAVVKETIRELSRTSVIYTIAHQRSTIEAADYLIVIQDGHLEHGVREDFKDNEFYKAVMTHV